ncbi:hypothetical protein MIMGU_mgv1a019408mg [Erythranthe guttata]|uniref:Uncharacterized protein n=1 Tax=Erythranthe guttata TaxID=4155 RepID=A0A022Q4S1_ERYGU|nr:hypothetical protein MIMGU_mgv1a019408mg [Erythranthe guttata]
MAKDPENHPVFFIRFLELSALLSDVVLNIREAHVFSTCDGYSLDLFVVDGWHSEVVLYGSEIRSSTIGVQSTNFVWERHLGCQAQISLENAHIDFAGGLKGRCLRNR